MTEIEKMFENAKVEPINFAKQGAIDFTNTIEIYGKRYPDFTAEKQIELIKWLCQKTYRNYLLVRYDLTNCQWQIECNITDSDKLGNFTETVASMINNLWQDLTDQEKEEIRRILNDRD